MKFLFIEFCTVYSQLFSVNRRYAIFLLLKFARVLCFSERMMGLRGEIVKFLFVEFCTVYSQPFSVNRRLAIFLLLNFFLRKTQFY